MTASVDETLRARVKNLDAMPAMPAILGPLLQCLELPAEQVEIEKLTELISRDKSIAAQCLRMANSALFSRRTAIETIRGAVVSLGVRRLHDILWTSFLLRMAPKSNWPLSSTAFWEHSFGCALVSQQFAKKISLPDPEKVYLCGLLHDIGELVNSTCFPKNFATPLNLPFARIFLSTMPKNRSSALHIATAASSSPNTGRSRRTFKASSNFTTRRKPLPPPSLSVAIVNLSDLLCRLRGMGYGYDEMCQVDFHEAPAWVLLQKSVPQIDELDIARFTFELDAGAEEIRQLVAVAFQS